MKMILVALFTLAPLAAHAAPAKTLTCALNGMLADGKVEEKTEKQTLAPASDKAMGLSASIADVAYDGRLQVSAWAHQKGGDDFPAWKADFIRIVIKDLQTGVVVSSWPRNPGNGNFVDLEAAQLRFTFSDAISSGVSVECQLR